MLGIGASSNTFVMEMVYEVFPEESIKLIVLREWNVVKRRERERIQCAVKRKKESLSFLSPEVLFPS